MAISDIGTAAPGPTPPPRFRVLRYFSIANGVAAVLLAAIAVGAYVKHQTSDLLSTGEEQNVGFATVMASIVWSEFGDHLTTSGDLTRHQLIARSETNRISNTLKTITAGLPVLKVKIFHPNGKTLFSSDYSQIGEDQSLNAGFQRAGRDGAPASKTSFRGTFSAFSDVRANVHLIETYVPIKGSDGSISAVFELYTDITTRVEQMYREIWLAAAIAIAASAALYCMLFLVVLRADHAIAAQDSALRSSLARLDEARLRLDSAIQNLSHGVTMFDPQGRLALWNNQFAMLYRLPPSDIKVGMSEADLDRLCAENGSGIVDESEALNPVDLDQPGDGAVASEVVRLKNGRYLAITTRQLPDGGRIRVQEDITARRRYEERIVALNADLEQRVIQRTADATAAAERALKASRAKSNFLAVMSHEIRTPMNAVLGLASSLLEAKLDNEHHQTVRAIYESGDNLLGILNDILDYSKLEAGRMEFEKAPFLPREAIDNTLSILALRAEAKNLTLSCVVDPNLPHALVGDGGRIRQVLLNIVANAIKFTEAGEVTIRASLKDKTSGIATVEWSVVDTGIGIEPENVNKLFGDYTQADSTINRKFGGTGLGLSICKRIVEQLGGYISLSSQIGIGTTVKFTVSLPVSEQRAKFEVAADTSCDALIDHIASLGRRLAILVVDDNATNRLVVSKMLQSFNIKIDIAGDGIEAITAAGQKVYDAILMDVRMPEMDGYEATRRIRQQGGLNCRTPIIALTANAFAEDVAACKAAGMDGFAAKPIRKKVLVEEITTILRIQLPDANKGQTKHSRPEADTFERLSA